MARESSTAHLLDRRNLVAMRFCAGRMQFHLARVGASHFQSIRAAHLPWQRAVAKEKYRESPPGVFAGRQSHTRQWQDGASFHEDRDILLGSGNRVGAPTLKYLPGPEIMPLSLGQNHLAGVLTGEQWSDQHPVAHHVLVIDRKQRLVPWIVHDQGAKGRCAVERVLCKGAAKIGNQAHAPLDDASAPRLKLFPVRGQIIGIVFLFVNLLPRRVLDVPGIDHRQRRKDYRLQPPDKVFVARRISYFGTPQKSAEARVHQGTDKFTVAVQIAVQHKWIWGGQRAARADKIVGWFMPLSNLLQDRVLIPQSKDL